MKLLNKVEKQFSYWKTVNALKSLPPHVADDLGVTSTNVEQVARRAVWG